MHEHMVSIIFSHFCERARWALDFYQVAYTESGYLPGFHILGLKWAMGLFRKLESTGTPALKTIGGEWIQDSGDIIKYAHHKNGSEERTLYPASQGAAIAAWEDANAQKLGAATRRIYYFYVLQTPELIKHLGYKCVGTFQAWLFMFAYKRIAPAMMKIMRINEENMKSDLVMVRQIFAEVGEQLEKNGTGFMFGDSFTAADVTFASLAAPLVTTSGDYASLVPDTSELPVELKKIIDELTATRAGQHAVEMFRNHRPARQIPRK
eukprot:comp4835_c0_seq1/m.954 comp4835_c0_seq1/g.954  ORF comp4835_c0_seq1/g.954 comp4835_c0_seq1/m.954 type:complete len:265 (-) comp4835_c0_seq1:125-919(-)